MLRLASEVRSAAIAVQANLVALKVAESRRQGIDPGANELRVSSPGVVRAFREHLINPQSFVSFNDLELHLALREVWGQFCLMVWLFFQGSDPHSVNFADWPDREVVRCATELDVKHAEVQAILWALRFELRRRHDGDYRRSSRFANDEQLANKIPVQVLGKPRGESSDGELQIAICEHSGMLAALRWAMDRRRTWNEPGILDLCDDPFE